MPRNNGTPPPFDRVDVQFVNGHVERGIEPGRWRWTRNDPKFGKPDWDIDKWMLPVKRGA